MKDIIINPKTDRREITVSEGDWKKTRDELEIAMWDSKLPSQRLISATLNALFNVLDSDGMNLDESRTHIEDRLRAFWLEHKR